MKLWWDFHSCVTKLTHDVTHFVLCRNRNCFISFLLLIWQYSLWCFSSTHSFWHFLSSASGYWNNFFKTVIRTYPEKKNKKWNWRTERKSFTTHAHKKYQWIGTQRNGRMSCSDGKRGNKVFFSVEVLSKVKVI